MRRRSSSPLFLPHLFLLSCCFPWLPFSASQAAVEYLPGFDGPLPFYFETGYVGVGEWEDVQLFYYFVKSQGKPETDPLVLWLTGGPGCSALSGLFHEIGTTTLLPTIRVIGTNWFLTLTIFWKSVSSSGPIHFKLEEYNGKLPSLILNPDAWTQVASIIFVDLPVLTGFSYARTEAAALSSDNLDIDQAVEFLRKWLKEHGEFKSNPVYIGGDSYAGIHIPGAALRISNENEQGIQPVINLEGYLVGNGRANATIEQNSKIKFAHRMALISDELYEVPTIGIDYVTSLRRSCGGEYYNVDPSNSECIKHVRDFEKCTSGLYVAQILSPECTYVSPKPTRMAPRRSMSLEELLELEAESLPRLGCPTFTYLLSKYWANDESVQSALRVRKVQNFIILSSQLDIIIIIINDTNGAFFVLVGNSGDHDLIKPYVGTLEWIRSLNFRIVDEWRPWLFKNQVAGVEAIRLLNTSPPSVLPCFKDGLQANHSNDATSLGGRLINVLIHG
ncbi:unnamed protein product [Linum tenue]|uniref:Serine carboxypeptidase-like 18 n=1 Tax=Linum tenue TaxID=586396 RepID=A0AAV0I7T6_9ROSI|nr:unnamed protein product [Linum tenue]